MAPNGARLQAHESLARGALTIRPVKSRNDGARNWFGAGMSDTAARKAYGFSRPPGRPRLALFCELWERFSYYGMQALLVLYLSKWLLLPGHIEHICGLHLVPQRDRRSSTERSRPKRSRSPLPLSMPRGSIVTPILGGLLADRVLGRTTHRHSRRGSDGAGQFLMALRPDIPHRHLVSAHRRRLLQGQYREPGRRSLYARTIRAARMRFQIYFLGIQIAVIVAPIVCGSLGEKVDWHSASARPASQWCSA